jgi:hypothetical protein
MSVMGSTALLMRRLTETIVAQMAGVRVIFVASVRSTAHSAA